MHTRRDLLRSGGYLAAVAAVGASGCLGRFGTDGGADEPALERWLPSEAAFGVDGESYFLSRLDVATVVENHDRFDRERYERFVDAYGDDSLRPPVDTVETVTTAIVPGAQATLLAVEGSFSREAAVDGVTGAGNERTGDHAGYEMYAGDRGAFGVREGTLVGVPSTRGDADELARTVIDAGRGEAERLVAADDDAARLVEALGSGFAAVGLLGPRNVDQAYDSGSLVGMGRAVRLTADAAELDLVFLYDDAEGVDPDAVRSAATDDPSMAGQLRDVSASSSGRVARVTGHLDADQLTLERNSVGVARDGNGDGDPPTPPEASFEFDHDPDAGTVTVTHGGGEAFTTENTGALLYGNRAAGEDALREWPLPVAAGDSVTVDGVASGDGVVVIWESPGGDTMPVGTFQVP